MDTKLRKILIRMSKYALYSIIIQISLYSLAFAIEGEAQQKSLEEINTSIGFRATKIEAAFRMIENSTDFRFAYRNSELPKTRVTVVKEERSLADLLRSISEQAGLSFKRIDGTIYVKPVKKEKQEVVESILEEISISGKVTDEAGEGLPGATVNVKGTTTGTITDVDGRYTITAPDDAILVFSFVGYITEEIPVNNTTTINVAMSPDITSLEEIVVIGYGTQKKSDLTGAISSISNEEMNQVPATSLDQAMIGRAAGVQITQTSGQPGGAISIRIRGGNSISAGNEPLYVIDGVPISNGEDAMHAGVTAGAGQNALSMIDPKDIESIEILKDASSTAIYGSRGANGVVLITTKMGDRNQNKIDFDMSFGLQEVRKLYPLMNAREYALFVNEAERNGDIFLENIPDPGEYSVYTQAQVASYGEGTNWQKEIFRTAPRQDYKLTFSGGNEDTRYLISGSYLDQKGIIINSDFKRAMLRVNLEKDVTPKLTIGNNLSISQSWSDQAYADQGFNVGNASSIVLVALGFNPILPVRDPATGEYTFQNAHVGEGDGNVQPAVPFYNPVAYAHLAKNESNSGRILGRFFGAYQIFDNLEFRTNLGYDILSNKQNHFIPGSVAIAAGQNGVARVGTVQNYSITSENMLTYNKTFAALHDINILAGFSTQQYEQERLMASAEDFSTDALTFNNLGAGEVQHPSSNGVYGWSLVSYLGRINYKFKERYLLTLTARTDGSSRFGKGNRYGFFPSGAFAWRVSEEPFMQSLTAVSSLKLRTSYGITGNQELPPYQPLALLDETRTVLGNTSVVGFMPIRVANNDLKWETTAQFDVGIDFGLVEERIRFTADYYHKKTTDLLLEVFLPTSSGFSSAFQNVGSTENKGFEFSVEADILTGDFTWTAGFNIARNRNKVLNLGVEEERFINVPSFHAASQPVSVLRTGEPLSNFYGYQSDGFFNSQEEIDAAPDQTAVTGTKMIPGTPRFVDVNGDGVVDTEDRVILGDANPDFSGGFSTTFSYKGFNLSALFSYSYGNEVYNANRQWLEFGNGRQNATESLVHRWSPANTLEENRTAETAIAINPQAINPFRSYDRWIEDGSYLRLNNVIFSYNIPVQDLGLPFRTIRCYVSGQNLLTFTDYTGFDPEVNRFGQNNIFRGFDVNSYPSSKSFTLGVSVGL